MESVVKFRLDRHRVPIKILVWLIIMLILRKVGVVPLCLVPYDHDTIYE